MLRCAEQLSDGQLYRFRLALALSLRPPVICIDEFCATLDRVTAAVIAHNVRKCADKFKTTFIVATSHDDLIEDLAPDVVAIKHLGNHCDVYYPSPAR
jgi:ABC-type ATPase with predicted acetyltransferase domain